MEFKGTKGKWYCYRKTDQHKVESIMTQSQEVICDIRYLFNEQSEANAKLISCAPEMLDFIQSLIGESEDLVHTEIQKQATELIKKATEI
jgi:hypothetical protein